MKNPCPLFVAAALLVCAPLGTLAQSAAASATTAAPVASASPLGKATPQVLTPAEKRETATMPGELRPEAPTATQLSISVGQGADNKPSSPSTKRGKNTGAGGGINDSVARCNAEVDETERAKCRDRLAHPSPKR